MRFAVLALLLLASPALAKPEHCQASVYSTRDKDQPGTQTASGVPLNDRVASIAHKSLPLKSKATITNLQNGRTQTFTITDRGPHVAGRCIDLSVAAAIILGCNGLCPVSVQVNQR